MLGWFKITKTSESKTLGQIGEEIAQLEYKVRGYKVIAANFFNRKGKRLGEVDFIASSRGKIIFVEVKTRATEQGVHGTPAEAVDAYKQAKLLKAVKTFLLNEPKYRQCIPQIDVAVVIIKDLRGLKVVGTYPQRFELERPLDKLSYYVTIIPNAVEDHY